MNCSFHWIDLASVMPRLLLIDVLIVKVWVVSHMLIDVVVVDARLVRNDMLIDLLLLVSHVLIALCIVLAVVVSHLMIASRWVVKHLLNVSFRSSCFPDRKVWIPDRRICHSRAA